MAITLSAEEKRWRAEDDARTLAEAERIKEDKARMDAAQAAAKKMAEEEEERIRAMRKIARSKRQPGTGSGPQGSKPKEGMRKPRPKTKQSYNVFNRI